MRSATPLTTPRPDPTAVAVDVGDTALRVTLADGRAVSAPLVWFPRLRDASPTQRAHWTLIGQGMGIHWPEIDEDISVETLRLQSADAKTHNGIETSL